MKRILLTIGSLVIAAVVVVSFVNAGSNTKNPNKQTTELSKDNPKGPCCPAACKQGAENKTATCNKEKESAACCKTGEAKCEKQACKTDGTCPKMEGKPCCKEASAGACKSNSGTAK